MSIFGSTEAIATAEILERGQKKTSRGQKTSKKIDKERELEGSASPSRSSEGWWLSYEGNII